MRYSELDCNGHLSNTKYLNWMEDLLPTQWHRDHALSKVHICYLNEARADQEIALSWVLEDEALALEGRGTLGKPQTGFLPCRLCTGRRGREQAFELKHGEQPGPTPGR